MGPVRYSIRPCSFLSLSLSVLYMTYTQGFSRPGRAPYQAHICHIITYMSHHHTYVTGRAPYQALFTLWLSLLWVSYEEEKKRKNCSLYMKEKKRKNCSLYDVSSLWVSYVRIFALFLLPFTAFFFSYGLMIVIIMSIICKDFRSILLPLTSFFFFLLPYFHHPRSLRLNCSFFSFFFFFFFFSIAIPSSSTKPASLPDAHVRRWEHPFVTWGPQCQRWCDMKGWCDMKEMMWYVRDDVI